MKIWAFTDHLHAYPGDKINPEGHYALKGLLFKGWLCDMEKGQAVDKIISFLKTRTDPHDSVLVMTDLQIIYALTGMDGFKGIPSA